MFQKKAIEKVMKNIEGLTFPHLLVMLRSECGVTYTKIATDTGIGLRRMQRLETGMFRNPVSDWEIENLAKFYGISDKLLKDLMCSYVNRNKYPKKIEL